MGIVSFNRQQTSHASMRIRIVLGGRRMGLLGVMAGGLLCLPQAAHSSDNFQVSFLQPPSIPAAKTVSPADPCLSFLSSGSSRGSPDFTGQRTLAVADGFNLKLFLLIHDELFLDGALYSFVKN